MAALDAAVGGFVEGERAAARRADGAMAALMAAVETEARALWPGASVAAFGSRATELASGASDLDLVVVGVPELDQFAGASPDSQLRLLAELAPRLAAIPGVASAALQKSSVPVVAVVADAPAADAPAADAAAPAPAAARLRVDVSLQTAQHSGLVAAEHVRCLHACLPALAPIVVVLKALLNRHHLKSAFTGGLSSYALTVMVARFLLHHQAFFAWPGADADGAGERDGDADGDAGPKLPLVVAAAAPPPAPSVGSLLLACMHFYADVFSPADHAVGVGRGASGCVELCDAGFVHRGCGALAHFDAHPLLVCDPTMPANNVGKSAYKASQIQRVLRAAAAAALRAAAPRAAADDDGAPPLPPLPAEAIVEALIAARPE